MCWAFDGKDGRMGRAPATCAYGGLQVRTALAVTSAGWLFVDEECGGVLCDRGDQ